jgi:uncharacterized membrane protein YeaQ/YmgE (transglycosylase-associated protein family)
MRRIMAAEIVLVWIMIGAFAGFLAGTIVRGYGFGLARNIAIVGAFLTSILLPSIELFTSEEIVGQLIAATIGVVTLLALIAVPGQG